jgi:addiction module RelB/DinJ family antitoxin
MASKSINFKVEEEVKEQFERVAKGIGITPTALLSMFVKKAIDVNGIPFEVRAPQSIADDFMNLSPEERREITRNEAANLGILNQDN